MTGTALSRFDIEARADGKDRMMLAASSASTSFGYALERGWITQDEYDAARKRAGNSWNYCGD